MKNILLAILLLVTSVASAQTKVGGIVVDEDDRPVAFANLLFKDSYEGTITDDNGHFYMESDGSHKTLVVSFIGWRKAAEEKQSRGRNSQENMG